MTGLTALLLGASAVNVQAVGPNGQRADPRERSAGELKGLVDSVLDTGVVGAAAEVTSPGRRDNARSGTAELGTGRPMPADGRFRIGSATKTFTAAVVLQLVGERRLSLDDTVERWLPGVVRGDGIDGSRITVRQLLQHTSGIPEVLPDVPALNTADGYLAERYRTYTPEELVQLAMSESPPSSEGTWSYSNTNYVLAAMIVQKVTGRSWAQEIDDRIIRPLGLRDTSTPGTDPSVPGPHAEAYSAFSAGPATGGGSEAGIDVTTLNPSMAVGSGAIISTTYDLGRFYAALLGGRVLAPAQLDEMTTTVAAPPLGQNVRYGLGLGEIGLTCGGSYFGHVGQLLGYRSWVGVTRDGTRTATVYVTSDGGPHTQDAMMGLVDRELCASRS